MPKDLGPPGPDDEGGPGPTPEPANVQEWVTKPTITIIDINRPQAADTAHSNGADRRGGGITRGGG